MSFYNVTVLKGGEEESRISTNAPDHEQCVEDALSYAPQGEYTVMVQDANSSIVFKYDVVKY